MNRSLRQKTVCFFFVIVLGGATSDGAEIRLKRECVCPGNLVWLSDIADIVDADKQRAVQLGSLTLFPAPTKFRIISDHELEVILRLKSVDLARYQLTGAESVRITKGENKTRPVLPPVPRNVKTKLSNESSEKETSADKLKMAVFAVESIRRGELIQAQHVELRLVPQTGGVRDLVYRVEDVVGKEASQSISPDRPITSRSFRNQILVRRREEVTVIAIASGIRVKSRAIALEEGSRGQTIMVQTLGRDASQYTARVVDFHTVEVFAGGPRVSENGKG